MLSYGYEGKHGIGTETDGANTVMLMGARLYDPATGRFLQVDPVLGGSANAYDYVDQDPSNTTDLDGYNVWNGSPGKPAKFACNAFFLSMPFVRCSRGWLAPDQFPQGKGEDVGRYAEPKIPEIEVSAGRDPDADSDSR